MKKGSEKMLGDERSVHPKNYFFLSHAFTGCYGRILSHKFLIFPARFYRESRVCRDALQCVFTIDDQREHQIVLFNYVR
jgi:hypothetical protein